ncbi:hypothetical protein AURDEDRAFT_128086 [Auricularia subglabra TFB-10046 SS5]|uniref:Uncharacterized protein n=1 Tax=Auricularia subglabra (strain TFB-10046 / SS5) TaxID=717982 RepID=J0WW59_AURST|nr:hypothetical protein AURDEDRAFT_128086 [Auricularia subglabra TFB-10046 SS5]
MHRVELLPATSLVPIINVLAALPKLATHETRSSFAHVKLPDITSWGSAPEAGQAGSASGTLGFETLVRVTSYRRDRDVRLSNMRKARKVREKPAGVLCGRRTPWAGTSYIHIESLQDVYIWLLFDRNGQMLELWEQRKQTEQRDQRARGNIDGA